MSINVYAHRGFSGMYPENTMIAFSKAIEDCNCNRIELDVHLSKDDNLVIIHDEKVDRTTDGVGFIKDKTIDEIKALNANYIFNDLYPKQSIPTFDEYCEYVKDKNVITNIELKTNLIYYDNIEEKVINTLKRYNLLDRVIISSFNHSSTIITKQIDKTIPCGLLVDSSGIINIGKYATKLNMNAYHPDVKTLTKQVVQECKDNNIQVNTWTVNSMKDLMNCVDWDVEGIITNYPNVVSKYING